MTFYCTCTYMCTISMSNSLSPTSLPLFLPSPPSHFLPPLFLFSSSFPLLPFPLLRAEEEAAGRTRAEKEKRDLQALLQETQDDLESEKEARVKVEKMRRQLNEVREDGKFVHIKRGYFLVCGLNARKHLLFLKHFHLLPLFSLTSFFLSSPFLLHLAFLFPLSQSLPFPPPLSLPFPLLLFISFTFSFPSPPLLLSLLGTGQSPRFHGRSWQVKQCRAGGACTA